MHMVNYRPGNTGHDFSVFTGGGRNRRRGLLLGWAASPNEMGRRFEPMLESRIGYMLARPVGRPTNEVRPSRSNFSYQVGIWTKPRRVIAKVGWRPGELYLRVGLIATKVCRPSALLPSTKRDVRAVGQVANVPARRHLGSPQSC